MIEVPCWDIPTWYGNMTMERAMRSNGLKYLLQQLERKCACLLRKLTYLTQPNSRQWVRNLPVNMRVVCK